MESQHNQKIVLSTVHKYDWVQLGARLKHPEHGKQFILDDDVRKLTGRRRICKKIYCHTGYGNPEVLRNYLMLKNQTQSYTLQTQDFGDGCMIWKMKLDKYVL